MTKILKWVSLTLLIGLLCLIAALFWYRSASRPQTDGEMKIAGLTKPIDIVRDAHGVPHIFATSANDAYFALGFVHAQDRLWQLELNRRIVEGRMAEILGSSALPADRVLRTLGVRRNAERIFKNLAPETRSALDAYARGINAYLATRSGPLPPEFIITGAPAPLPWQAADSIGWQTMMAWDLGANWTQELLRMRLAQRLSLAQINEFLAPYPGDAPLATQDYTKLYRELAGTAQHLAAVAQVAPSSYVEGMGSNEWAVSGALSKSGKPLLANDPHLGLTAPSLWYLAHLSAPGMNVIGATLPGIPGVVLGRNDRIAGGFTNTAPDVQDLYIERINPDNHGQYQTPSGWVNFQRRIETIRVKGAPDVRLEVRESRHGPVLSGALPVIDKGQLDTNRHVIAFAWTALRADDLTLQAGTRLNLARNWEEFLRAVKDFDSPQQNMVYADVEGNIGFVAPGRVPVRKPNNDLKGLAPAPGWDSRYDWIGFIPFDRLPRRYNPPSHRIITANDKIVGNDYPYFLTSEWALPYRARRIAELIDATPKHNLDDFAAMQKDDWSLAVQELLPILRRTKPASTRDRAALDLIAKWNGRMDADRTEPLIVSAWLRELSSQIFSDELGIDLMKEYGEYRNFQQALDNVLHNKSGMNKWCLKRGEPAIPAAQACDALMAASLETALNELERRYGHDQSRWRWGDVHVARSEHRPFGRVPSLARWFDIRVPTPGDAFTINAGRNNPRDDTEPFASRHAAGFRALYDLADLENSRFIQSTGQSGNVFSPLYRNFVQRWANVDYLPMRTRRDVIEKGKLGTLRLVP